jgi:hypothetical protein
MILSLNFTEGVTTTTIPMIPEFLNGSLQFVSTHEINEHEAKLFSYGFSLIAKELEFEKIDVNNILGVSAIASLDDSIELKMESDKSGTQFALVDYPIQRWKNDNYNDIQILTCILEELCHHYWSIKDETLVEYKVTEIMKRWHNPEITIEQLYKNVTQL